MNINSLRTRPHPTDCSQCPVREKSLFSDVTKPRLDWIQNYRKNQLSIPPKTDIFQEGEKHDFIYTLFSGWGFLYKTVRNNGKRQILRFLLPGDLIGYQTISSGAVSHSAATLTDVTLCAFPRTHLKEMLIQNPELALRLMTIESRDMSLCQSHLMATGRKTAKESIAFILLELFYRSKSQIKHSFNPSDNSIVFPLSQEDIGDTVGLTNVHVNRVIKNLMDEGLIICNKKRLTIINEEALSKIAEFDPEILNVQALI